MPSHLVVHIWVMVLFTSTLISTSICSFLGEGEKGGRKRVVSCWVRLGGHSAGVIALAWRLYCHSWVRRSRCVTELWGHVVWETKMAPLFREIQEGWLKLCLSILEFSCPGYFSLSSTHLIWLVGLSPKASWRKKWSRKPCEIMCYSECNRLL